MFTARGQGKEDFRVRQQIAAALGGLGDLVDAKIFVAVNSTKPEREAPKVLCAVAGLASSSAQNRFSASLRRGPKRLWLQ